MCIKTGNIRITSYLRTSIFVNSAGELKKGLFFLPVKTGSIILVTAILTNIFLSLLIGKEIGIWGWIVRGLFLFIGFGGLFCNLGWNDLKRTASILRYMNK